MEISTKSLLFDIIMDYSYELPNIYSVGGSSSPAAVAKVCRTPTPGTSTRRMTADRQSGERQLLGHRLSVNRNAIHILLNELCIENEDYYERANDESEYTTRMSAVFPHLQQLMAKLKGLIMQLQEVAPHYDFDEKTPGNGYRSLICICDTVTLHIIALLKIVYEQKSSFTFRYSHYCKELEAYATVIEYLCQAIPLCLQIEKSLPHTSLFPPLQGSYDSYHEMLKGLEKLDSTIFYGRPLGFQFSPSVNRVFRIIGVILASYSLTWEKGHGKLGSLLNTGRFFLSPEQRASRIIKVTKEADINFCKGFWNLSELTNNMPKFFCPSMYVNELREINWIGPITMETTSGGTVKIPEPSAHTGPRPVKYRIFSAVHRQNVSPNGSSNLQPPSPYLVIHAHGGGYVATSSKSHETYLRVWAKLLNCTVVSIEYSLAPENPFPRPTEEVLFAYAWMVNNPQLVGWTGEKLCMVGDSAGGNLIMSVNLRLIELNVKRKPDGLVPVYTPFLFQYLPSPSRMLSVMDPLLHMGVVLRCVAAYTGAYGKHLKQETVPIEPSAHRSLQDYVDQVQKQRIDFEGGSQSIVSLVQGNSNGHHDYQVSPTQNGNSYFITNNQGNTTNSGKTNGAQRNGKSLVKGETIEVIEATSEDSSSDEEADTTSIASVHVESDPYRIQLTETLCDGQLLDFLIKHPATKDQLTMIDENGEAIEERVEENLKTEQSDEIISNDDSSNNNNSVKRPKILGLIGIGNKKENSSSSVTAPSTPYENHANGHRTIASSCSVHSFPMASMTSKRSISQSLAETAVMAAGHAIDNLQEWLERPAKEKLKLERTHSHKEPVNETLAERKSHLLELLSNSSVPRDPLISPMYASDDVIKQLPPVYFIACHLDPLLDDTIEFAKKLRSAGGTVASLDLLSSVPHGFLNFTMMSPECRQGAKVCLQRIKQALGIEK